MASEIKVDTISEKTSAGGVTIDGLLIKDGNISGDVALAGTTPTFTIGDAGAEDAALVFDGNAQDYHVGLDDSSDSLVIGLGSALGTTPAMTVNASQVVTFARNPVFPDGGVAVADLDIDGATDIGAAVVDADLFIVVPAYVLSLEAVTFLFVPPAPSSTMNKSASTIAAPMSVPPSISRLAIGTSPAASST